MLRYSSRAVRRQAAGWQAAASGVGILGREPEEEARSRTPRPCMLHRSSVQQECSPLHCHWQPRARLQGTHLLALIMHDSNESGPSGIAGWLRSVANCAQHAQHEQHVQCLTAGHAQWLAEHAQHTTLQACHCALLQFSLHSSDPAAGAHAPWPPATRGRQHRAQWDSVLFFLQELPCPPGHPAPAPGARCAGGGRGRAGN